MNSFERRGLRLGQYLMFALALWTALSPLGVAAEKNPSAAGTPPVIDEQPIARTATVGGHATLSVIAHGTTSLSYQWWNSTQPLTDNSRVTGTTNAVLNIDPIQVGDTSNYFAVVSSTGGAVTSAIVSLVASQIVGSVSQISSTGWLVVVFGQPGDVYRIEVSTNFGSTYYTNGFATNRSGRTEFLDRTTGDTSRFYRVRLDRILPVLYPGSLAGSLRAYGKLNQIWRVESTGDFQQWDYLRTVTNLTGWVKFTDTSNPLPPARYYRMAPGP